MAKKRNPYPKVEVAWLDAATYPGHYDIKDIPNIKPTSTAGYLIKDDYMIPWLVLAGDYSTEDHSQLSDIKLIPRGMIVKISRKR